VQAPFVDVENVMGTALSDVLRGSDGPNLLEADGGMTSSLGAAVTTS
jgi:hypothetical protein